MQKDRFQDEIMFDRLVDGELTESQRRQLLASLDERPDGWRQCALAFLEAQTWTGDFGQMIRKPFPSESAIETTNATTAAAVPNARRNPQLRQVAMWLVVAASLLVAFTLGSMQSGDDDQTADIVSNAQPQIADVAPSLEADVPDRSAVDDAITLWVRDDTGQRRTLRVPLIEAGELDRELGVTFQSAIPTRLREQLQERGYNVQSRSRYAPLWLENGQPMIVPVEDTKIVPVGQHVY